MELYITTSGQYDLPVISQSSITSRSRVWLSSTMGMWLSCKTRSDSGWEQLKGNPHGHAGARVMVQVEVGGALGTDMADGNGHSSGFPGVSG